MRDAIVHRAAQKLADWYAGKPRLDPTKRTVRDDISRALEEIEGEMDGASEYLDRVEGNEYAELQDKIVGVTDQLLRAG